MAVYWISEGKPTKRHAFAAETDFRTACGWPVPYGFDYRHTSDPVDCGQCLRRRASTPVPAERSE